MTSPGDLLMEYRKLMVPFTVSAGSVKLPTAATVSLKSYFMINWTEGTEQYEDYSHVTSGGRKSEWFQEHKESIKTAAMGKGRPGDYALALQWAVDSGKIKHPNAASIQSFCDNRLGIDCSGFVTNYLARNGKKPNTDKALRGNNAASYYSPGKAINNLMDVKQGDLLVWMTGNAVKTGPGHIAVVDSFSPQTWTTMQVVEATAAKGATPKLLSSSYVIESIEAKDHNTPVMILTVKRHSVSGHRVCVIRP